MSQLVQMRQRIKSIETIKKVTHAMRLISMSSHARFRAKKTGLQLYQTELKRLFSIVQQETKEWQNPRLQPTADYNGPTLIILVGSQKGLCGIFNTLLFQFFEQKLASYNRQQLQLITIGKKADEYAAKFSLPVIKSFTELSSASLPEISNEITNMIIKAEIPYAHVSIFSNYPKTFFAQKPEQSILIPFQVPQVNKVSSPEEYTFEQAPETLLDFLANRFLFSSISELLLNSLVAESAARFIAMDNSTRNATNLLDDMKLDYNKLRQAKITRELTDLIGSL